MVSLNGLTTRVSLLLKIRSDPSDQIAWQLFVDRFGPLIHAWCRHWKLQEADAQDVTQIVLLKLVRTLPDFEYDATRSFRGWLRTITLRTWSDFIESQQRGIQAAGDNLKQLYALEARDDLYRRLQDEFDQERAEQAMELVRVRVEPHTWDAFRLTAMDGLTTKEAAGLLQMSIAGVYRARSVVQAMLKETIATLDSEPGLAVAAS